MTVLLEHDRYITKSIRVTSEKAKNCVVVYEYILLETINIIWT